MSGKVCISVSSGEASCRIDGFMGDAWGAYQAACNTHGFRWNRLRGDSSRNQGPVLALPGLIRELIAAKVSVELDEAARASLIAAAASGLSSVEEAALRHCEAMEAAVAEKGIRLRQYQRDGVVFLGSKDRALIADEMGLGKTVQALLALPRNAAAIVVCPATLKLNWAFEAGVWRPDLTRTVLMPESTPSRARDVIEERGVNLCFSPAWPKPGEIVIWNYESMGQSGEIESERAGEKKVYAATLTGAPVEGTHLIGDELHRIKSSKSITAMRWGTLRDAVKATKGRVWGATGTPLFNRPPDLASVLRGLGAFGDVFTSWTDFVRRMGGHKGRYGMVWNFKPDVSVATSLKRVMLRREKKDVLGELPPKTYQDIEVIPTRGMMALLSEMSEKLKERGIDVMSWKRGDATMEDYAKRGESVKGLIEFSEMSRLHALISDAAEVAAEEIIEELEEADKPHVVFCVHKGPVERLGSRPGWTYIHGDVPADERSLRVADFQAGKYKGIASTIAVGSVGITLTRAQDLTMLSFSWNPSDNAQAEDRVHRIGQVGSVTIRRCIVQHPITIRMAELLSAKTHQVDVVVGKATVVENEATARRAQAREALEAVAAHAVSDAEKERMAKASEAARLDTRVNVSESLAKIPEGCYALDSAPDAAGKTHTVFWILDKPASGRWAGWAFLKVQQGPSEGRFASIRPDYLATPACASVLSRIAADPLAASRRYGRELGRCGVCSAPLTNEESRAEGIGPICKAKFGA